MMTHSIEGIVVRNAVIGQPLQSTLFGVSVVIWIVMEISQGLRRRSGAANSDRYSLLVLRACITGGMLLAGLSLRVSAASMPNSVAILVLGLCLMWAGGALRWWCFRTLGRYFTFTVMTSPDQSVVTSGPYRFLRHPSYAGMLLALAGVGLVFGNWLSLAAAIVVPLIGLLYRIHVEETALASTLGHTYTSYAFRRKRLVPLVW
jgi:protein-S-isoprenylcysteine O-methyltransferase Ste14